MARRLSIFDDSNDLIADQRHFQENMGKTSFAETKTFENRREFKDTKRKLSNQKNVRPKLHLLLSKKVKVNVLKTKPHKRSNTTNSKVVRESILQRSRKQEITP